MAIAFTTLAQQLVGRSEELCREWFPNGKRIGREWKVGNLQGIPGQSLSINLDTFRWGDFATGQKGGDAISLYAAREGVTQGEAARRLSGDQVFEDRPVRLRPALSDLPRDTTVEFPPNDAPLTSRTFGHKDFGLPSHVHVYRTPDKSPWMVVARYETAYGKQFCPFTWREGKWRPKGHAAPRPLYGLDRLEDRPGPTIVVEGEKAADALQLVTERSSVVTWSGGANNWKHADWSYLRGRRCILWPDADAPGFAAMQGIAGVLLSLGCELQIIDTEGLPESFDAADLLTQSSGAADLNDWIKARLRPVREPQPAPQLVQRPGTVPPAVTLNGKDPPPSYAIANQYGLSFSKAGVHANMANARALIAGRIAEGAWHPIYYDTFLQKVVCGENELKEWSDWDTLRVLDEMQSHFGISTLRKSAVEDAISLYAFQHQRNCAQEWLRRLEWDGHNRVEQLFIQGFKARGSDFVRAVGRCFMVGMAARVMQPGCQVDYLPVIEGEQGKRKTSGLRELGGEFHVECQESVMSKDFYLVLHGKLLVEIAELHSFRRADIERIKGIITNKNDRFRAPYERRASDHPRSCVFAATTNRDDWNQDDTGARRFWPIECREVDVEWIRAFREQLFAEAMARYSRGESWWDVPTDAARIEQAKRRGEDVIWPSVQAFLRTRSEVTVAQVIEFGLGLEKHMRFDRHMQSRVSSALRVFGYRSKVINQEEGSTRVWVRGQASGQIGLDEDLQDPF